jgi:hypothetical protein
MLNYFVQNGGANGGIHSMIQARPTDIALQVMLDNEGLFWSA